MIGYEPGDSMGHRLDPRTKLFLQAAFVAAAYAHTEPFPLAGLTLVVVSSVWLCHLRVSRIIYDLRYLLGFLALATGFAALQLSEPWLDLTAGIESGLAAYRVLLIVVLSLALVSTTSPAEAQAALTWLVPGRLGRAIGVGVAIVFRFLPIIHGEAQRTRRAMHMRGAQRRPAHERIHLVALAVLSRLLQRTDRLSFALRARCLAWNPTPAALRMCRIDVPAGAVSLTLLLWAFI